jgi:hypothetical protein
MKLYRTSEECVVVCWYVYVVPRMKGPVAGSSEGHRTSDTILEPTFHSGNVSCVLYSLSNKHWPVQGWDS